MALSLFINGEDKNISVKGFYDSLGTDEEFNPRYILTINTKNARGQAVVSSLEDYMVPNSVQKIALVDEETEEVVFETTKYNHLDEVMVNYNEGFDNNEVNPVIVARYFAQ